MDKDLNAALRRMADGERKGFIAPAPKEKGSATMLTTHRLTSLQELFIQLLAATILGIGITLASDHPTAQAQTTPTDQQPTAQGQKSALAPAPGAWSQVQALRQELCLTNTDLAAMGLSQQDAARLLQTLVDWQESHAQACEQAEREVRLTSRAVREAYSRIHVGPRDEVLLASLPGLKLAAQRAQAQRKQVVEAAAQAVAMQLSSQAQTIWQTARGNTDLPDQYRYAPNLSREDKAKLLTPARRLASDRDRRDLEQSVLAGYRASAMEQARVNINANLDAVTAAEAQVLPTPPELAPAIPPATDEAMFNAPSPNPSPEGIN